MKNYLLLALWVVVFEIISASIGYATQPQVDGWYAALERPWFTPPNLAFPIMWTLLYALIGAAGFYIWQSRKDGTAGRQRLSIFMVYMALNWSWSFIFFTQEQLFIGLLWILVMNIAALALIAISWKPQRRVAVLMIPPVCWTLFAALLNGAFWWLNRGA